jgi:hypothetical protein
MVKGDPDSFIGVLCTSWVFYRDTDKRNDDGDISNRPFLFARVSSTDHEPFIMRLSAEWFKAAKAYMDSPSLGRSVHHVRGHRDRPILNSQVHRKQSTPKDWEFEVLTKMVVIQKHQIASKEWLVYARAFLAPDLQQSTPRGPKRDLSPKTKGVPKRIGRNRPTNEKAGRADKKRTRIEAKAFMVHSELGSDDDRGIPYRLIQNEPTPASTQPTFSAKDHDDASTLTQITDDLVALQIGYNLTSLVVLC